MIIEWRIVDRLCYKQTGYILNHDKSWSPPHKPYVKDWDLSVQVIKMKCFLDLMFYSCLLVLIF